jgi:hypothetical protein
MGSSSARPSGSFSVVGFSPRHHAPHLMMNDSTERSHGSPIVSIGVLQHTRIQSRSCSCLQSRRSGDQDNPLVPAHGRMRAFDRDLIRGGHYSQPSRELRK